MKGVILLLMLILQVKAFAQPAYNDCNSALELCPNKLFPLTNSGANKTFCPGCEDDFSFCFSANNTIWLTFTTNNVGGDVQVDFSSLNFETNPAQGNALEATILEASIPCNSASYTAIGNCVSNSASPFSLVALALPANTVYYIVLSGSTNGVGVTSPAAADFNVSISGQGINRSVPTVNVFGSAINICKNVVFTATAQLADCPDTTDFKWFINGILTAETTGPIFQTTNLSDGDVVSVETSCYVLCPEIVTDSATPVIVYDFPLDAGADQLIEPGETAQLNGTTSAPIYSWSPSYSVNNTLILDPFVTPAVTTTYTLTATENGCTKQDFVTVTVDQQLIFPTTFSPNADGTNDTWEIGGIDDYPNCFVRIFNRWGQEIFQSSSYSKAKAWDGTANTGKLAEGVYFYIVELRDSEKRQFKGSITLIR